jgi:hypothetical protein
MVQFNLKQPLSVNDLIALGIPVELDPSNKIMRLQILDKDLTKSKCDLIEQDCPIEYPETYSILELSLKNQLKSLDSSFGHFTTSQSEDLIFSYFEHELLPSNGVELVEVVYFQL